MGFHGRAAGGDEYGWTGVKHGADGLWWKRIL